MRIIRQVLEYLLERWELNWRKRHIICHSKYVLFKQSSSIMLGSGLEHWSNWVLFRLARALTQVLWIGLLEKVVFGYVRLHVGRRCFPRRICGFPATMNAFNFSILEQLSASPGSPLLARKKTDSKLIPKPLIQWLNAAFAVRSVWSCGLCKASRGPWWNRSRKRSLQDQSILSDRVANPGSVSFWYALQYRLRHFHHLRSGVNKRDDTVFLPPKHVNSLLCICSCGWTRRTVSSIICMYLVWCWAVYYDEQSLNIFCQPWDQICLNFTGRSLM